MKTTATNVIVFGRIIVCTILFFAVYADKSRADSVGGMVHTVVSVAVPRTVSIASGSVSVVARVSSMSVTVTDSTRLDPVGDDTTTCLLFVSAYSHKAVPDKCANPVTVSPPPTNAVTCLFVARCRASAPTSCAVPIFGWSRQWTKACGKYLVILTLHWIY